MRISDDYSTTAERKASSHRTIERSGLYYRVVAPGWKDPGDTTYSKQHGGRWNPAGEFGVLYLNATLQVAAANARSRHAGRALKLFDLLPDARPELVTFSIPAVDVLDVTTAQGIAELGFAESFPYQVGWPPCQAIARVAHAEGLDGVAARSSAEATASAWMGEELALFDTVILRPPGERRKFHEWYPDPIPGANGTTVKPVAG